VNAWPHLSVVLCVRNGLPELYEQLDALGMQSYPGKWELIAVEDGSTDNTRAALDSFAATRPGTRIVHGPAQGLAAARVVGARVAHGDAFVFVDHDDIVAPGYLTALGAALADHEFVAARVDLDRLNPSWLQAMRPAQQTTGLAHDHWPFGSGGTLAIRRETYERIGGHDRAVKAVEDRDLCFRAAHAGVELTFVPDAVLHYRYRRSLGAIYRAGRRGARCDATLFARHRQWGYPALSAKVEAYKFWLAIRALVIGVLRRDRTALRVGVLRLGRTVGHVEGCFAERVAFLQWNPDRTR
jgi:glycosyltransferase involved in cell wall biosynthesis